MGGKLGQNGLFGVMGEQKQRKGTGKTGEEGRWEESGERRKEQGSRLRGKRAVLVEVDF